MAIRANIVIDQGTDYSTTIDILDDNDEAIDISSYSGESFIRKHYSSLTYYSFDDVNCYANGTVELIMTSNTSASIPAGRYVYDCKLNNGANVISRIVEGILTVTPQVTKANT